jgi:hypothetical protein
VKDSLIVGLESGTEVIADRTDVMVWPPLDPKTGKQQKATWAEFAKLDRRLRSGNHPFKTITFDTMSKGYTLAMRQVMAGADSSKTPEFQDYGKANAMVNDVIETWCTMAKETGINVVFIVHAAEIKDEASGIVTIRMDLTPGVMKSMYQNVSAIGYLETKPALKADQPDKRKLLLRSTSKINAKFRQPQSGPQLPLEIEDPSLLKILEHRRKANAHLAQLPQAAE